MKDQYKILKILDDHTILVDYGTFNKAKRGDELRIIEPGPKVEIDGRCYGTLDAIKDYVEVTTAYEHFSVCKKIVRHQSHVLSPLSMLRTTSSYESMEVDESEIDKNLKPPDITPIKVGDIVEKY